MKTFTERNRLLDTKFWKECVCGLLFEEFAVVTYESRLFPWLWPTGVGTSSLARYFLASWGCHGLCGWLRDFTVCHTSAIWIAKLDLPCEGQGASAEYFLAGDAILVPDWTWLGVFSSDSVIKTRFSILWSTEEVICLGSVDRKYLPAGHFGYQRALPGFLWNIWPYVLTPHYTCISYTMYHHITKAASTEELWRWSDHGVH